MALTSAKVGVQENDGAIISLKLAANQTIYQGAMVTVNSSGLAEPADDVANVTFVGVAQNTAKSGASDSVYVACKTIGEYEMTTSGATQASVGQVAYATDDETVTTTAPTNQVKVGIVSQLLSATSVKVRIKVG